MAKPNEEEIMEQVCSDCTTFMEQLVYTGLPMVGGALLGILAAPHVVQAAGFGSEGIKAGTPAASMMRKHKGSTPSKSLVASGQRIGATGSLKDSPAAAGIAGGSGAIAAYAAVSEFRRQGPKRRRCPRCRRIWEV